MTLRKREVPPGNWRMWIRAKLVEVFAALPRLLLAFLLALVVVKPLELRLFQPEVNLEVLDIKKEMEEAAQQIAAESQAQQPSNNSGQETPTDRITFLKEENKNLAKEIDDSYKEWQRLNEAARRELQGESGDGFSGKAGDGILNKNRQLAAKNAYERYSDLKKQNNARIEDNDRQLGDLNRARQSLAKEASDTRVATDGLAIRLAALSQLTSKDTAEQYKNHSVYRLQGSVYRYANWCIMAIIALLELAPILSKIFTSYGPYERAIEAEEEKAKLLKEQDLLSLRTATETLRNSRAKRLRALLEIQDTLLMDLKDDVRNVSDDSQITKAELNEMKRSMFRQAIAGLSNARPDGQS